MPKQFLLKRVKQGALIATFFSTDFVDSNKTSPKVSNRTVSYTVQIRVAGIRNVAQIPRSIPLFCHL